MPLLGVAVPVAPLCLQYGCNAHRGYHVWNGRQMKRQKDVASERQEFRLLILVMDVVDGLALARLIAIATYQGPGLLPEALVAIRVICIKIATARSSRTKHAV